MCQMRYLEELFRAKLEYGGQLILAKHLLGALRGGSGPQDGAPAGVHTLDDQVVQHHLLLGSMQDIFFHTATGQEPARIVLVRKHKTGLQSLCQVRFGTCLYSINPGTLRQLRTAEYARLLW